MVRAIHPEQQSGDAAARRRRGAGGDGDDANAGFLSCDEYIATRALPQLRVAQAGAAGVSAKLKALQLLVLLGSAVCVVFQRLLPLWTPVVLSGVSTVEFFMTYLQLDKQLPALNGTALAITRALIWWDGLSLIQQRMPTSRDRFVDVVETALLMQHQGFVQAAIENLGKELDGSGKAKAADEE